MPTIELLKNKKSSTEAPKHQSQHQGTVWSRKCYNTARWRKLREAYLMAHPLCELCEEKGIVEPASDVHHKMEISQAGSFLEAEDIAFDSNNLMALCSKCHDRLHADKRKQNRYGNKDSRDVPTGD